MNAPTQPLADDAARRVAIADFRRSILVEAGAGSGKTAIMAGRIALMLADGIAPKAIAAVTFTELAASELLFRVREFVGELTEGRIPRELGVALPNGLSDPQQQHLAAAYAAIDEITCSTIHGFCQRLIKPYPVEANIDPGAALMDPEQVSLTFTELVDDWLREILGGDGDGLIAGMVLENPDATIELIRKILAHRRDRPTIAPEVELQLLPVVADFRQKVAAFTAFMGATPADEKETAKIVERFGAMAQNTVEKSADLVRLLLTQPGTELCTQAGGFRAYRNKGKWATAAKCAGLSKADGERLNVVATAHYEACCTAWTGLRQSAASRVLADLVSLVQPVIQRFRDYKRSSALLDFDDLIFAARDLLRDHEAVRCALAARFSHVLVDEFQDTDPLQTEIFWRLCGEPPADGTGADWTAFQIRPGALFLVGDPKQAIYRFRGADVAAYLQAREALLAQDPDSVLSISTNFRSCAPILRYVNERFAAPLAVENGQPGFTALDPFHPERDGGLCVAALDIAVADEAGKASSDQQRDGEAATVAELCARLIGSETIRDHKTGERRPCQSGDIALLAPTGSELWRYEEALEHRGIPVATQAGKGLFRRQEIQDLIALTRVLADQRDTLALGALLRGPLVGLTEEELLDLVWALPRSENAPEDALPRLHLGVEPAAIGHPYARDLIEKLQALRRLANATTPYDLLSRAIDVLRVRPVLLQRHGGQAERVLANVDLYLALSRAYSVRGLRAFAERMTAAWTDETRAIEGRPDAQEAAVALYTIHAAKGLEWPIVIPINCMTRIKALESVVTDRVSGRFYCPVFGVKPLGYEATHTAERDELNRERLRLWYVAATRARELLVLPRFDLKPDGSAWLALLDLSLTELPAIDLSHLPPEFSPATAEMVNAQTRDRFAAEAAAMASRTRRLVWRAPSRDEGAVGPVLQADLPEIRVSDRSSAPVAVQGGRERGLILHKLIEEVLTGETPETIAALIARTEVLIQHLGCPVVADPAQRLAPVEIADCVTRTLALPEIAALRPTLRAEFPVYASILTDGQEEATAGIADAIAFNPDGTPQVIIDWKSDVKPTAETLEHYRAQVRAYLNMTGAGHGLIVLMTSGVVIPVTRFS